MPAMLLSKEEWNEVRKASEAGVDDSQLSKDYGVSKNLIKQKRFQQKWMTPLRVKAEAQLQRERKSIMARASVGGDKAVVDGKTLTVLTAEESVAAKMVKDGEVAGLHAMKILLGKLAFAAANPSSIDDLESVGDVSIAAKTARSIAGLDKPDVAANIALNFGAFWESPSGAEVEKPRVLDV